MITLENDSLVFRFPEVHEEADCTIEFQRTLRIPDDRKSYPLPPGLGAFPLRHLDDYASRVPDTWAKRGGVIMPMHQAEAMWINFSGHGYPFAVKVATGKIDAVTGKGWFNHLNQDPQDYLVIPNQPWLDGYCVAKGEIRQFIAMPLGAGYTAEEQITGEGQHGGVQIIVYPMKAERYEALRSRSRRARKSAGSNSFRLSQALAEPDMGLAPGGRMQQEIYSDPFSLDAWDQRHGSRCFVTIANSEVWRSITGVRPPTVPPTAAEYGRAGLPWFDYYDEKAKALDGAEPLARLDSVAEAGRKNGQDPLPENEAADVRHLVRLGPRRDKVVREAEI